METGMVSYMMRFLLVVDGLLLFAFSRFIG